MVDRWKEEGLPRPGTSLLNRYHLDEAIARGGMAMVYRGHDRVMNRTVAVKVLPQRLRTERSHARFLREARLAAQITHANVVVTYDAGLLDDGIPFLVMEFLEGKTVYQLLKSRGRFPVRDAVLILGSVLEGVQAAHDRGVIHRDLKPSNVHIGERRQVKVIDFGLSKDIADRGPRLTGPREALGTPSYMSPEQVLADPADARTDVWGAGTLFYEMVVGKRAFPKAGAPRGPERDREVREIFATILRDHPPRPSDAVGVPPAVDEFIYRALAKSPDERFQTMEEMQRASEALFRA
ncbi:MAG: serine/threonine-protein kinase [Myxococcota bacterium]